MEFTLRPWNLNNVDVAFKTFDINRVYATPFATNNASHRILKKSGFKLEARLEKKVYKNGEFSSELIDTILL